MSTYFKRPNRKVKKRLAHLQNDNPIVFDSKSDNAIWVVLDQHYSPYDIQLLRTFLGNVAKGYHFNIVEATTLKMVEPPKAEVLKTYRDSRLDFEQLIPENSKIIVCGRALYALNKSDDILPQYMYDHVSKIYDYYHPELNSYVWPVNNLYEWLGADNFKKWFAKKQIKRCIETNKRKKTKVHLDDYPVEFIDLPNTFLKDNMHREKVSWDIETSGLEFYRDKIGCITMSFDGKKGYYLPWDKIDLDLLNEFLKDKYQILAFGKFDCKFLRFLGITNARVDFDTVQVGHLINEMRSNSAKTHAWLYTTYGGYDRPLEEYKEKYNPSSYLDIPDPIKFPYASMDSVVTFQIYEKMEAQITNIDLRFKPLANAWTLRRYMEDIMIPSIETFIQVEMNGMHINIEQVREVGEELKESLKNKSKELYEALGCKPHEMSVDSAEQLGLYLEKLGWKDYGRAKTGKKQFLTAVDRLEKWKKDGHKAAQLIIDYRELSILLNTFIGEEHLKNGIWKYVFKHKDGSYRVHSTFFVMLANSGRNKSDSPNLQNQPSKGWKAKLVRRIFCTTSKDHVFGSIDYAGLQLRLMAMTSNDPAMRKAFIELGGDLHSATAQTALMGGRIPLEEFLEKKHEEPYSYYRFKAKGVNFGLIFGAMAVTIMKTTIEPKWTLEECDKYIIENKLEVSDLDGTPNVYLTVAEDIRNKFFETYFVLEAYLDRVKVRAKKDGYVRSCYGAFRRLPQLMYRGKDDSMKEISHLLNIALNSTIQNMESVIVMRLMNSIRVFIEENDLKSELIGQIHDAIELEFHKDELKELCSFIKKEAEIDFEEYNGIPLEIEGNIADYWGTFKRITIDRKTGKKVSAWELWDIGHDWNKYLN